MQHQHSEAHTFRIPDEALAHADAIDTTLEFAMRRMFRRIIPDPADVCNNRWLAPFRNNLLHPQLWRLNRHSAAGAVATGLFCGLIPGPLQMLGAAICCLVFRVNLPLALVTTLYTNPLTIVPLYFIAFAVGQWVLGTSALDFVTPPGFDFGAPTASIHTLLAWAGQLGKPLAIGLVTLATSLALTGYVAVKVIWRWIIIRHLRQRRERKTITRA